jgi:hypothetical protein
VTVVSSEIHPMIFVSVLPWYEGLCIDGRFHELGGGNLYSSWLYRLMMGALIQL